jgi:hypothetical protein
VRRLNQHAYIPLAGLKPGFGVRQLAAAFVLASLLAVKACRFRLLRREQAR